MNAKTGAIANSVKSVANSDMFDIVICVNASNISVLLGLLVQYRYCSLTERVFRGIPWCCSSLHKNLCRTRQVKQSFFSTEVM